MITIFAEHFLNDQGRDYFPDWIAEMEAELRFFDGFKSIEHMRDLKNSERNLYFLQFDAVEHMREWAKSRIRAGFLKKIEEHETSSPESQVLCSASADDFVGF